MDGSSVLPPQIRYRDAFWTWSRVAALSFGGPAGQIAVMHRILVDEKKWIDEGRFLHALNFCMLLPGPEAQQLATYIGWLLHGPRGGFTAGLLFILPGCATMLALSIIYAYWQDTTLILAVFFGLKPSVLAIVLDAVARIGRRIINHPAKILVAVVSFLGMFLFQVPFPLVILLASLVGVVVSRFERANGTDAGSGLVHAPPVAPTRGDHLATVPSMVRSLAVLAGGLVIWFAPVVVAYHWYGTASIFAQEAYLFSQAAVVTFGGAYSVLAYIAQQAVNTHAWLLPGEMMDGLGMAETTPGPLIMVVQFVGFMAAFRHPPVGMEPLVAGILGSFVTTWVTFVPCFLWIFLGAPYVERLRASRVWTGALSYISAAVVGVILKLAIWFAVHALFGQVDTWQIYGMSLLLPQLRSIDWGALLIVLVATALIFRWRWGMLKTMAMSIGLGVVILLVRQARLTT